MYYILGKALKPIYQFDLDGNFIKKWSSAKEVEDVLGFRKETIKDTCRGRHFTSFGYKWSFNINLKEKERYIPKYKKVNQYDLQGNFIKRWESSGQAKRETKTNNVNACCRGLQKQAGGYIWKYEEEVV